MTRHKPRHKTQPHLIELPIPSLVTSEDKAFELMRIFIFDEPGDYQAVLREETNNPEKLTQFFLVIMAQLTKHYCQNYLDVNEDQVLKKNDRLVRSQSQCRKK